MLVNAHTGGHFRLGTKPLVLRSPASLLPLCPSALGAWEPGPGALIIGIPSQTIIDVTVSPCSIVILHVWPHVYIFDLKCTHSSLPLSSPSLSPCLPACLPACLPVSPVFGSGSPRRRPPGSSEFMRYLRHTVMFTISKHCLLIILLFMKFMV
jgi:hypothetical protein